MRFYSFLLLIFLSSPTLFAQIDEVEPPDYIQTIEFRGGTPQAQLPIVELGKRLTLEFDDLNAREDDYFYTIDHYNFDWTPSNLAKSEYLDGFDDVNITSWENSYNTLQSFTHYRLQIPNRDVRAIRKSGNYLLSIYSRYGDLIFTRKFMVYEREANVRVDIKRSRDLNYVNTKQVVTFTVGSQNTVFINPDRNLHTLVMQNNNLKTAITDLKPQYTMGNELIYRYDQESAFWGGNEYFNFDNSDVRGATSAIRRVELEDLYINYLFTNISRKDRQYTYNPDINGNFVVRNIRGEKASIDGEYVWVHFALSYHEDIGNGAVHIYGNFNNFSIDDSTKMEYDAAAGTYRLKRLFKQGFYNYKYVVVDEDGNMDTGAIDGNFDKTENEYTVLVYYREPGGRFDRIIGLGKGNSEHITN